MSQNDDFVSSVAADEIECVESVLEGVGADFDGEEAVVAVLAQELEESGDVGVALADDADGRLVVAGLWAAHVLDVDVGDEMPEGVEGVVWLLVGGEEVAGVEGETGMAAGGAKDGQEVGRGAGEVAGWVVVLDGEGDVQLAGGVVEDGEGVAVESLCEGLVVVGAGDVVVEEDGVAAERLGGEFELSADERELLWAGGVVGEEIDADVMAGDVEAVASDGGEESVEGLGV